MRPNSTDYAPYYETYIGLVQEQKLELAFDNSAQQLLNFLESLPDSKLDFAYAPGKWTVRELLIHIVDTEVIFNFRALAFARGEQQSLPGYDHNAYALATKNSSLTVHEITNWFAASRQLSKLTFAQFAPNELQILGTANGNQQTVLAIGYAMCGHILHHLSILKSHYQL
jgi:uncharacterized damage-inducible protein DinB